MALRARSTLTRRSKTSMLEVIKADIVLLAMGFVHPVHEGLLEELAVEFDARGNVATKGNTSSVNKVFAAGDAATGASLVVRAMASGRAAASSYYKKHLPFAVCKNPVPICRLISLLRSFFQFI